MATAEPHILDRELYRRDEPAWFRRARTGSTTLAGIGLGLLCSIPGVHTHTPAEHAPSAYHTPIVTSVHGISPISGMAFTQYEPGDVFVDTETQDHRVVLRSVTPIESDGSANVEMRRNPNLPSGFDINLERTTEHLQQIHTRAHDAWHADKIAIVGAGIVCEAAALGVIIRALRKRRRINRTMPNTAS